MRLHYEIEQLVKPPLKISALEAVPAQGERPLVGLGGGPALIRPVSGIVELQGNYHINVEKAVISL